MSNPLIDALDRQRRSAWEQGKALVDHLEAQNRDFTAAEKVEWERINADIDSLDARIQQLLDEERRSAAGSDAVSRFGVSAARAGDPAFLAFATGASRARSIEVDLRKAETRDLSKGTATAGGHVVPTSFSSQLMEHLINASTIRQTNVTVLTTASGEDLVIPKTTSHSTAAIVAEGAAIGESDPAFDKVTLQAYKYGILIQVTRELVEDSGIDLLGYLARETGQAIGNASGAHFVTGTGSSQPLGVVPASTLGKTSALTAGASSDELVDLFHSVLPVYRSRATWMFSDATAALIRKLKDGDNQYIWQPGLTAAMPDTLLGRPVAVDPAMPAPTTGLKSIVFGDLSRYYIRDVASVKFERSDDYAFNTDLVTFKVTFRTDGDLIDTTGAVKHLIQA